MVFCFLVEIRGVILRNKSIVIIASTKNKGIVNIFNGSIINVGVVKTTSTFFIIFNKINALIFNT